MFYCNNKVSLWVYIVLVCFMCVYELRYLILQSVLNIGWINCKMYPSVHIIVRIKADGKMI